MLFHHVLYVHVLVYVPYGGVGLYYALILARMV